MTRAEKAVLQGRARRAPEPAADHIIVRRWAASPAWKASSRLTIHADAHVARADLVGGVVEIVEGEAFRVSWLAAELMLQQALIMSPFYNKIVALDTCRRAFGKFVIGS